tara:strand:- start:2553 stop:2894 length:342 start_codon:yes stop_codon:yes gene_type:complete
MDYKKRKHLLRCSALVEHRVKSNGGLLEWKSDGYVDFEAKIDMMFVMGAEEEVLNKVLSKIIERSNTEVLRYIYQDYELVFHFPIKLQSDIPLLYRKQYKAEIENITKEINKN